jgi:hypothetical protein
LDSVDYGEIYYANSIVTQNSDFVIFYVHRVLYAGTEEGIINFRSFSTKGIFLSQTELIFQQRGDLAGCGFEYELEGNSIRFFEKCVSTQIEEGENGQFKYVDTEPEISETVYFFDKKGYFLD